ncbi:unnamed protein product [Sphagnum tenellum]
MSYNRASEYVKDNDVRLGLRVSTSAANGGPQIVMQRRMILHSVVTLSAMLYFADIFKRQHWQKTSNILSCTYIVLHNPVLRVCSRHDVADYIRVVCDVNLQPIARHLRRAWAFSIAMDFATHQRTSYLDVRF